MDFKNFLWMLPCLSRFIGFFIFSPLFYHWKIPWMMRIALTIGSTLFFLSAFPEEISFDSPSSFYLRIFLELLLGYILGCIFSFLFEGALLAGQWIGILGGFSATELLNPRAFISPLLWGKTCSLLAAVLFFSLDLHHLLLKALFETFPSKGLVNSDFLYTLPIMTGRIFKYALCYAMFPFAILASVIVLFGILSRSFPSLQIFWNGFPIQLLAALSTMSLAVQFFPQIVQQSGLEIYSLWEKFLGVFLSTI